MNTTGPVVEVLDTVKTLNDLIDRLKLDLTAQVEATGRAHEERLAALGLADQYKFRKEHYKGIVERAKLVLQAAWLLDEPSIRTEVLADALLRDEPLVPAGPRPSSKIRVENF